MKSILFACVLVMCAATASRAQTSCPLPAGQGGQCSATVGTTPMQLTVKSSRTYQRIINSNTIGTLWCTRDPLVTPTAGGAGSFPIGPAGSSSEEEFSLQNRYYGYVPTAATTCVSGGDTIKVSVETQ